MDLRLDQVEKLLVTGGKQRRSAIWQDEWHYFEEAVISEITVATGAVRVCKRYRTPADACAAEDPGVLFKAGTLSGGRLCACTQTEILSLSLPELEIEERVSLPCFNDIHHATPLDNGNVLVANTGLDMVVEVSWSGEVVREWDVLGEDLWTRFSKDVDYRRAVTTQPHHAHPNFVFRLNDELWVTRFKQRDAVCLTGDGRIEIGIEGVHDGIVRRGRLYFTTVDGQIAIFDASSLRATEVIDLNQISPPEAGLALGWCRGIEVLEDRYAMVGFSRIRPTKLHRNLRWLKSRTTGGAADERMPTRVAMYDLVTRELRWEVDLEPVGQNAVFSIHPLKAKAAGTVGRSDQ